MRSVPLQRVGCRRRAVEGHRARVLQPAEIIPGDFVTASCRPTAIADGMLRAVMVGGNVGGTGQVPGPSDRRSDREGNEIRQVVALILLSGQRGVVTTIETGACAAMSEALIVASSSAPLSKLVARGLSFQFTTAPLTNPAPCTSSVKPEQPAGLDDGVM